MLKSKKDCFGNWRQLLLWRISLKIFQFNDNMVCDVPCKFRYLSDFASRTHYHCFPLATSSSSHNGFLVIDTFFVFCLLTKYGIALIQSGKACSELLSQSQVCIHLIMFVMQLILCNLLVNNTSCTGCPDCI